MARCPRPLLIGISLSVLSTVGMGIEVPVARGQYPLYNTGRGRGYNACPQPCEPVPYRAPVLNQTPSTTGQPGTTGAQPGETDAKQPTRPEQGGQAQQPSQASNQSALSNEPSLSQERFAATGGETAAFATPNMMGDQLSIPAIAFGIPRNPAFPPPPGAVQGAILVPSIRGFKISEDESPRPTTRAYFGFNYFDNVNKEINQRFGVDLHDIKVYRETVGLEKAYFNDNVSLGIRMPLNTLSANSPVPGLGGTSTDIGDLTVTLKMVLLQNMDTGNLLSGGIAVTAPTGGESFAGFTRINSFHNTTLQPYLGTIVNFGQFFLHGFSAIDVPTDPNDVTIWYNDVGVGYYLYRTREQNKCLTAVIPTVEVHVNSPLNHRDAFNINDRAGTPDVVDLTAGTTFEISRKSTIGIAVVTPVTGPKPFDFEAVAQFNVRFGGGSGSNVRRNNVHDN